MFHNISKDEPAKEIFPRIWNTAKNVLAFWDFEKELYQNGELYSLYFTKRKNLYQPLSLSCTQLKWTIKDVKRIL